MHRLNIKVESTHWRQKACSVTWISPETWGTIVIGHLINSQD